MSTLNVTMNTSQAKQEAAASTHHRVSTGTLEILDNICKIAAGCMACSFDGASVTVVNGALAGACLRLVLGDDPPSQNEMTTRAYRTASICTTLLATAFLFTPATSMHPAVQFCLGAAASLQGAFGLFRKLVD